jgi:hypothetical protein
VHIECDPAIDDGLLQKIRQGDNSEYICSICRETSDDTVSTLCSFNIFFVLGFSGHVHMQVSRPDELVLDCLLH